MGHPASYVVVQHGIEIVVDTACAGGRGRLGHRADGRPGGAGRVRQDAGEHEPVGGEEGAAAAPAAVEEEGDALHAQQEQGQDAVPQPGRLHTVPQQLGERRKGALIRKTEGCLDFQQICETECCMYTVLIFPLRRIVIFFRNRMLGMLVLIGLARFRT